MWYVAEINDRSRKRKEANTCVKVLKWKTEEGREKCEKNSTKRRQWEEVNKSVTWLERTVIKQEKEKTKTNITEREREIRRKQTTQMNVRMSAQTFAGQK